MWCKKAAEWLLGMYKLALANYMYRIPYFPSAVKHFFRGCPAGKIDCFCVKYTLNFVGLDIAEKPLFPYNIFR